METFKKIFQTQFGSHVYGTNTPSSDTDYKGIFQESLENILLKRSKDSIVQGRSKEFGERNTSEDVDVEWKELRQFIDDCCTGQTYALDLLFTPEKWWVDNSPEWEFILKNRSKLISKRVEPYIGYCRRQAGKYGLKGSRLGELHRVLDFFKDKDPKKLVGEFVEDLSKTEFVRMVKGESRRNGEMVMEEFLEILGKKFQLNKQVLHVNESLNNLNTKYGDRSKKAMENQGIDWKAVSHAFRCCFQLKELAETGEIVFPLKEAQFLTEIKVGTLDYPTIQEKLEKLMEETIKAVESSSLPETPDREFWDAWIMETYLTPPPKRRGLWGYCYEHFPLKFYCIVCKEKKYVCHHISNPNERLQPPFRSVR